MDTNYADGGLSRWEFHTTDNPFTRYLRDRRLHVALDVLREHGKLQPAAQSALVVCGGVGGEAIFLANQGFQDVTVSDLSDEALATASQLDSRIKTQHMNAEAIDLPDSSVDLVFVQDGLHHLPRPALGLTEMLRVARTAAIVIEPHYGLAGSRIGTTWERHGDSINYVFRWSAQSFEQTVRSYLLAEHSPVVVRRFWDHNNQIAKVAQRAPAAQRLRAAKALYGGLAALDRWGNMFVGVAFKPDGPPPPRLSSH